MNKSFFATLLLGILVYSCSTTRNNEVSARPEIAATSDTIHIANDSLEYEILIIEPGFTPWLATQRPRGYYSEQFLENRNWQYVVEYNQRVLQPQRFDPNVYLQQINYEPQIRYGYEVNYLLFHYFLYMEQRLGQRFRLTRGPRGMGY